VKILVEDPVNGRGRDPSTGRNLVMGEDRQQWDDYFLDRCPFLDSEEALYTGVPTTVVSEGGEGNTGKESNDMMDDVAC